MTLIEIRKSEDIQIQIWFLEKNTIYTDLFIETDPLSWTHKEFEYTVFKKKRNFKTWKFWKNRRFQIKKKKIFFNFLSKYRGKNYLHEKISGLKNDYKELPKNTYKKHSQKFFFSKINKKFMEKRKTYILSKKGMSKKSYKKVLKIKKNKPYIVTHLHVSLNYSLS